MTNILLGILICLSFIDLFYYIRAKKDMKEVMSRLDKLEGWEDIEK